MGHDFGISRLGGHGESVVKCVCLKATTLLRQWIRNIKNESPPGFHFQLPYTQIIAGFVGFLILVQQPITAIRAE